MDNTPHVRFPVTDRSYVAVSKREIHSLASQLDFTPVRLAEIDLVVAEMTSNLIKHAGGGEILARVFNEAAQYGIELISIDNGPGMVNPDRMLEDGVSTTNTLGQGLGAIKRLSDTFQLYSQKGWGTLALSRIIQKSFSVIKPLNRLTVCSLVLPKQGEKVCGDGFYVKLLPDSAKIFLGDGLGHGPEANQAVQEAIRAFRACPHTSPVEILRFIHQSVKKTRGLVGTVLVLDYKSRQWRICGVGNISTQIKGGMSSKNYMSYNGIIGLNIPGSMNDQTLTVEKNQQFMLWSDGLRSRLDIGRYPGIQRYDPTIQAAALYKDFDRKTDDLSILIGKTN